MIGRVQINGAELRCRRVKGRNKLPLENNATESDVVAQPLPTFF